MSNLKQIIESHRKEDLTATQKKYFKLLDEIQKLSKSKEEEEASLKDLLNKYNTHLKPIIEETAIKSKQLAILLDQKSEQHNLPEKTMDLFSDLIVYFIANYHNSFPQNDITKELEEKWDQSLMMGDIFGNKKDFENSIFREELKNQFGIDIDEDFDFTKQDSFEKFFKDHAEQLHEVQKRIHEEKASKKKTKKELLREQNEKIEKRTTREIYIGLAKILHPDRAISEEDRLAKEAAMKQATDAYDKNDIITLLNLEIKYFNYDAEDLLRLSNEKINNLIKSLTTQKSQLKSEMDMIKFNPIYMPIHAYTTAGTKAVRQRLFDNDFGSSKHNLNIIQDVEKRINILYSKKDIKQFVEQMHTIFDLDNYDDDFPFVI
jgi:hypothetical protein